MATNLTPKSVRESIGNNHNVRRQRRRSGAVADQSTIARPVSNASGRFVVLVGPDGVGKTAVARALLAQHRGPAAYFHFLPPIRDPLLRSLGPAPPPPPKAAPGGWRVLGWIRLLRNAVRCWLGYLGSVRPALKRSWLIIGDRGWYGYVVQPYALKFHGPEWLARAVMRLLPRPHLVVNLSAPPHVIRERKQELTLLQIERELLAWSLLGVANFRTVDATRQPCDIASEILLILHRAEASE
jgi:thymidylate kinase